MQNHTWLSCASLLASSCLTTILLAGVANAQSSWADSHVFHFAGPLLTTELYFAASNVAAGAELWRLRLGTFTRLTDIKPGYRGSFPDKLAYDSFSSRLFFVADDNTHGRELWAYDSTSTRMVRDIWSVPPDRSSMPEEVTVVGSGVVFSAHDGATGRELWGSNGTTASLLRDIAPGPTSSIPSNLVAWRGAVYFTANDGGSGNELWCTDGTAGNTRQCIDLRPGAASSNPAQLVVVQEDLYLVADAGAGRQIMRVQQNGAAFNASPLPLGGAGEPGDLTLGQPYLFFTAYDSTNGRELWMYDPSQPAPTRLTQIGPGAASAAIGDITFDFLRNGVWMRAQASAGRFEPFFHSIGSGMTERILAVGNGGPTSLLDPTGFLVNLDAVLCVATHADAGREIARMTPGAPATLIEIRPGPASAYPGDAHFLFDPFTNLIGWMFSANDGVRGAEPHFIRQGTTTAVLLADLAIAPPASAPEPEYHPALTPTALEVDFQRCVPVSPLLYLISVGGVIAPIRNFLPGLNITGDLYLNPANLVILSLGTTSLSGSFNTSIQMPPVAPQFVLAAQGLNLNPATLSLAFSNVATSASRSCDIGGWRVGSTGDFYDDDKQYKLGLNITRITGQSQVQSLWVLAIKLNPGDDGGEAEVSDTVILEPGSLSSPVRLQRSIQVIPPPGGAGRAEGHRLQFRVYLSPPAASEVLTTGCEIATFYC